MNLRGKALVLGALLLSTILVPQASGQGAAASSIDALLETRASAILDGDEERFMSTVGGSEAFRDAQRETFRRMRRLPLAGYELKVDLAVYGDLVRSSDVDRYGDAGAVSIPLTVERYRFEGYDRRPVIRDHYFTFVERDGKWRIESDTDLEDLGFFSARAPWELSEIDLAPTDRFLVISGACSVCVPTGPLSSLAARALEHVDGWWDGKWSKRVPILIPSDADDLARMIEATYPVDAFVAFAFWTGPEGENPGPRIVINPRGFIGATDERVLSILKHEIFHVASLPSSGPFIPRWMEEGFAQFVQYAVGDALPASVADGSGGLPADTEFFVGSGAEILQVYRRSLAATSFLVSRWGWPKAQQLYRHLGRQGNEGGTARFHQDRAMRKVLGIGLDRFERLWGK